ncbi:MAG: Tol-Pal system beta propeller repeat protein TolB [Gammaproteobacteria bacterium]|nr:Tol-Pal system beta propeller repeat protein TolB [Gammaproteobacteria bacterium]
MTRLLVLLLLSFHALGAWASSLDITISGGTEAASPIAVIPFGWAGSGEPTQFNLGEIIAADLERSGRFRTLEEKDMISRPQRAEQVEFRDWRALAMDHLVIGEVTGSGPDAYQASMTLFDVYRAEPMLSFQLPFSARTQRAAAHHLADLIYEKLTGEPGAFNTKVAYVTSTTSAEGKRIALQVADSDGYGPQTIVASAEPLMSPAWSPDGRRIAYVSFEKGEPSIYVQELANGQRRKLTAYPGINGAPAWSPDGSKLAMTLSKDGNPDIFVLDVSSGSLSKITNHYAIDTEPSWSPDGRSLVFTSDRGGRQQLYLVSASGGEPRRLTFEGQSNARGSFSPDGKSLVLETQTSNGYGIGLLDIASSRLRVLSNGGFDESPSFAPNGRMIIYATKAGSGGKGELAAVSVDGRVKQQLKLQAGDVREPAWSPKAK